MIDLSGDSVGARIVKAVTIYGITISYTVLLVLNHKKNLGLTNVEIATILGFLTAHLGLDGWKTHVRSREITARGLAAHHESKK